MLTGENGILTQAQKAKNETEEARIEEENRITDYEDYINNTTKETAVVGEIVQNGNKQYSNHGTAIIPEGFAIVPGFDNVEEGLVISDKANDINDEGNQFVWVPVPVFDEFKRRAFGNQEIPDEYFVADQLTANKFYELTADGIANTTEVEKMYKSVKDNKGFYIGRYEAGTETERSEESTIEDEVLSKKNKFVYNYIGWNNDGTMTGETSELGGAVEKARSFSTESGHTNVTSTLVYGVQWDAVMRWFSEDEKLEGYFLDSTPVGNYFDSEDTNNPAKTGAVDKYQLKNIYDIAGNVDEWTMEAYSTGYRVDRGGSYNSSGIGDSVSHRSSYDSGPNTNRPLLRFSFIFFLIELKVNGTAMIPEGFMIVPGLDNVEEGLVISDNASDTEKEGETLVAEGNQFVWGPVENIGVLCETSTLEESLSGSVGITTSKYSKSIISGQKREKPGTNGYREPDILPATGFDDIYYPIAGTISLKNMAQIMVNEYNAMIASIEKYRGFYIGRYELTNDGEKPGDVLTNTNWYNLYDKCKKIIKDNTCTTAMIWGVKGMRHVTD